MVQAIPCGMVWIYWLPPEQAAAHPEFMSSLHADELAFASTMRSAPRRLEYLRTRSLIRHLTGLAAPLSKAPTGAPVWPSPYVGSITHKDGFIGVALTKVAPWHSVGIDAEEVNLVREDFEPRLCSPVETAWLDAWTAANDRPRWHWLAVLFSFKEALFKCHYPLGETMFYFHDAEITHMSQSGTVAARLRLPTSKFTPTGSIIHGHYTWVLHGTRLFVLTSVILPRT